MALSLQEPGNFGKGHLLLILLRSKTSFDILLLSKVIFEDVPDADHREGLAQLIHTRTTSSLESRNLSLTDECRPGDAIQ